MTEIGDTDFGVQIGIGFLGKVATAVIGLVGSIIIARVVGAAGYGLFYVSLSISSFVGNTITGWSAASKKRMTETDFDTREALGAVLLVELFVIAVGGPLSYLLLRQVTENPIIPIAVPILFATTSPYLAANSLLSGRANFSLSAWSATLNTLVQTAGKVALVLLGLGVWGMVGGTVLGPLLVFPLILHWIGVRPSLPSKESLRSIARYARWSIPNGLVGTALSRMDTLLLGWLATASIAGKYQVGLQITMPAVFVSSVIGTGLMGRVSNLESRDEDWSEDLWNSLTYGPILAVPIFFGSLVLGEELAVTVFSGQYSGAGIFVVGLALYRLLKTQHRPFGTIINGLDRPDLSFRISLISFALNVALGVGLWFVLDALGIILATVLTGFVTYALTIYYVRDLIDLDFLVTRPLLKQYATGALMAVVVFALKRTLGIPAWYYVIAYLGLGAIIYGTVLTLWSPHLRSTARGIWKDFRGTYL